MKRYRVYFNRTKDAPQVWSVDEGDQSSEINVCAVEITGGTVRTVVDDLVAVNPDKPKVWMEVSGRLTVEGGVAKIEGGAE